MSAVRGQRAGPVPLDAKLGLRLRRRLHLKIVGNLLVHVHLVALVAEPPLHVDVGAGGGHQGYRVESLVVFGRLRDVRMQEADVARPRRVASMGALLLRAARRGHHFGGTRLRGVYIDGWRCTRVTWNIFLNLQPRKERLVRHSDFLNVYFVLAIDFLQLDCFRTH